MQTDIFQKRIKSARLLRGLSQRELSDKVGGIISHNAIAKYEKGLMMPNSKIILELSQALDLKADYFFKPYSVEIEKIEFRKRSKLSNKEENSIREEIFDKIAKYIELEQLLNISSEFKNPIAHIKINSGEEVEAAVEELIKYWKIGYNALPNVIELLEDNEIKVLEQKADLNFDGLSGWANGKIPVIVVNTQFTIERIRFTALHELGHLLLNFNENLDQKTIERYCHRFAGAMLIPRETFFKELGDTRKRISISELIAIKETYGISIQAIMARAKNLDILPEPRYISFRLWINESEDRKKEIGLGSFIGKEQSSRFRQLLYRATSEEIISMSKAANLANQKLATFRDEYITL